MKNYNKIQTRVLDSKKLKIRALEDDSGEKILEGYAALYGKRSKLLYDSFYEIIEQKAFDNILKSKDLDVVFNFNHDDSLVMGRTTNGTLKLSSNKKGLFFTAKLPETSYANDVYELVKRGDVFQNSFAFLPAKDGFRIDDDEKTGKELVTVTKIEKLRDVSAVTFPAYSETKLEARQDASTGDEEEMQETEEIGTVEIVEGLNKVIDNLKEIVSDVESLSEEEEVPDEEPEDEEPEEEASDRKSPTKYKYLKLK